MCVCVGREDEGGGGEGCGEWERNEGEEGKGERGREVMEQKLDV